MFEGESFFEIRSAFGDDMGSCIDASFWPTITSGPVSAAPCTLVPSVVYCACCKVSSGVSVGNKGRLSHGTTSEVQPREGGVAERSQYAVYTTYVQAYRWVGFRCRKLASILCFLHPHCSTSYRFGMLLHTE